MFDPENPFIIDPILLAESCNGLFTNQLDKGNSGGNRVDGDLTAGQEASPHPPSLSNDGITSRSAAVPSGKRINYNSYNVAKLKEMCRKRGLKLKGRLKKGELVQHLIENDAVQLCLPHSQQPQSPSHGPLLTPDREPILSTPQSDSPSGPSSGIDAARALEESAALGSYFEAGLREKNGISMEEADDESDEEEDEVEIEVEAIDTPKTHESLIWADKFILETRRPGGRRTEDSVLKQWKAWATGAINSGVLPDIIVDARHIIEYLQYAATRRLLTTRGNAKLTEAKLSASSLKKIMTMLGRVRRRQEDENPGLSLSRPAKSNRTDEFYRAVMVQAQRARLETKDFDVTKGTILESALRPEQLDEVTNSIFNISQLGTQIKAHFSWSWQCSTMNRGDEIVNIMLRCIHPYNIQMPEFIDRNGKISSTSKDLFGVLAMHHETKTAKPGKTEPVYSYVLPHRNPLRCPVGALAILLYYIFHQEKLMERVAGWNWDDASSWGQIHLIFGKTVDKSSSADSLGRLYKTFLGNTSITNRQKMHLMRRVIATMLEDLGVPADQIDAVGHWAGNTRREVYGSKIPKIATAALAGFLIGETYDTPWARVDVPDDLCKAIFPFCEEVISRLRSIGHSNQGTFYFLELLQKLRPFFWRTTCAIRERFPESRIIKGLHILSTPNAIRFQQDWTSLLAHEEASSTQSKIVQQSFHETPTRHAFSAVSERLNGLEKMLASAHSDITTLKRRTDFFSPSKPPSKRPCLNISSSPTISTTPALTTTQSEIRSSSPTPCPSPQLPSTFLQISTSAPALGTIGSTQTPAPITSNQLTPIIITTSDRCTYQVLQLSPPHSTPYDIILPPPSAFYMQQYPAFTPENCSWQHIFDKITTASEIWTTYAPGNLGDYRDIQSLWTAWDEGTYVPGVGKKAAIRMIDSRWGNLKSLETKHGRLASWRPHNDSKARKIWSNFYFFVTRIEQYIKTGHSSAEAVDHFESLRAGRSLSQLHKHLQVKRKLVALANEEGGSTTA